MKSTDHLQMPELINSEYTVQLSEKEKQEKIADAVYAAFGEAWQQCGK